MWSDLRVIKGCDISFSYTWFADEEDAESDEFEEKPLAPIERLGQHFKLPLESAGVDVSKLHDEFYDMLLFATQFISLSTFDYRAV